MTERTAEMNMGERLRNRDGSATGVPELAEALTTGAVAGGLWAGSKIR